MEVYSQSSMEAYSPLYNNTLDVKKKCFEQGIVALNIHQNNSFKHYLSKGNKSDMDTQTKLISVIYISFHLIAIQTTIN